MAARRSGMENIILKMIENGKSNREIAELTGVNYKTVARYKTKILESVSEVEKSMCAANFPPNFQLEWTLAVNRIRKHLGKELFPMPEEREEKR